MHANTVVRALRDAGFDAYLVGGCVRDLLLNAVPKDFDVATSATPEQVKSVFRRARLVGRRFRIAHVRFRNEIIEVSTFRRHQDIDEGKGIRLSHRSEEGVILRDNAYGTIEEDAFRRDFTINALYYDPIDDLLMDFTQGLVDIESQTLKLIGDPLSRFREDPVRILRAIRFAAKLNFKIDTPTAEAIEPMSELLTAIPPARLFDEFNKLFMNGNALAAWGLMWDYGLPEILFPISREDDSLVTAALKSTDNRVSEEKPVTPGFLLAAFCWPEYQRRSAESATMQNAADERLKAAHAVINEQQLTIAFPRRFSMFVRDVWNLQNRLERGSQRNLSRTLGHPRFRAAYDFLVLRAETGEADEKVATWWTDIQAVDGDTTSPKNQGVKPRKRRRRRRNRNSGKAEEAS